MNTFNAEVGTCGSSFCTDQWLRNQLIFREFIWLVWAVVLDSLGWKRKLKLFATIQGMHCSQNKEHNVLQNVITSHFLHLKFCGKFGWYLQVIWGENSRLFKWIYFKRKNSYPIQDYTYLCGSSYIYIEF